MGWKGGNENAEIENLECNYQPLFFSVGTKWGGRSGSEREESAANRLAN